MTMQFPQVLVILDGFGHSAATKYNAIAAAHMPHMQYWTQHYPHTLLHASGTYVGLLPDMPGNSLVGHTTIGAGQVITQPITTLLRAIDDKSLQRHPVLLKRLSELRMTNKRLHLMGLLSNGASHAHEAIPHALIRIAAAHGIRNIVVHAFLDGRDTPPHSAIQYLENLERIFAEVECGVLGSIHGRAYAMDRTEIDAEQIQQAFTVLTTRTCDTTRSWRSIIETYYAQGVTDEFIPSTALQPDAYIHTGDALIAWNIRADRSRILTHLLQESTQPRLAWCITSVPYAAQCTTDVLVPLPQPYPSLIDVLHAHDISVCCIAESEKYAHVSYFFKGRYEDVPRELYITIPSLPPHELSKHPEMRACDITIETLCALRNKQSQFYLINYANADMLGHTGDFALTVKSLEILDTQLGLLYDEVVCKQNGILYITADHGNAECMFDERTRQPHTSHTSNPVPFILVAQQTCDSNLQLPLTQLSDIAPYLLTQFQLPIPLSMQRT